MLSFWMLIVSLWIYIERNKYNCGLFCKRVCTCFKLIYPPPSHENAPTDDSLKAIIFMHKLSICVSIIADIKSRVMMKKMIKIIKILNFICQQVIVVYVFGFYHELLLACAFKWVCMFKDVVIIISFALFKSLYFLL